MDEDISQSTLLSYRTSNPFTQHKKQGTNSYHRRHETPNSHSKPFKEKNDTTLNIIINKAKELNKNKNKTIDIKMNINKYNIKYYLNNNSSTSLDNNSKYRTERTNLHTRSRNVNRKQSFSTHMDEHKGKNSVLLTNTTFAKTQSIFLQNKKSSIDSYTDCKKSFKHTKHKSRNDSSIVFPIINEIQSCNSKHLHHYSFDNKRKQRISLLSDRYIHNSSDSNSSLKIISDNGSIRKSSLNKNQLFIDDTDDDHFIINKQLTLQLGNKHKKRKKLSRYTINSNNNANIKSIKCYNEDNSSEMKPSLELGNISNVNIIQNTKSKFILRKQPLTIINNHSHHKKRQSLQINLLTNHLRKSSKETQEDNNQIKPNNRKRYRRQRESFLQQYARSLTIGEQYNYFSFFQHQVNNYEENNISQIEAENFVNNMFDLVKEAEETNKTYDDVNEIKNLDFNSSFYVKSKAMMVKSFSKQIKEKNENISNHIELHKKESMNNSIKHIHNLILKKTTNKKIHSTYLLFIEKNIHNIIHEKQEKKEIIRMSLSLFDKLSKKFHHNKNNIDIHEVKFTKELMLPSYNCILLSKYFDVKQEIEEYIFLQEYIIPKQITYHAQLSRMHTLNKKEYSKMQKIENYICTSYEKKDNMLYVNYFTDKDTTVYLLNDLYKNSDNYGNYYHKDNNRKLTRFSVCGRPFGNQHPPLKLTLPNSRETKRNSTIHGKNISHTITPQYPNMITSTKNNKLCLDNFNNNEYHFIRQNERKYTYNNSYKLIPYKDSLLYKLTCINNQSINISFKKESSTFKEYLKSINTNKSLITNDSLFMRKNETKVNQIEQESSPQKEKLPEFKSSINKPSFIQPNKPTTNINKISSSLSKILYRTVDKTIMNNQIGNNLYKIIMYHIANNNSVIVETIILDNKDRLQMNYQDEEGNTFLICAIKNKCNSLIKFLLESGCDPNLPNHYKNYPLHYAVSLQNYDVVNTLIAYGAQEKSVNTNGLEPWQCIGVSLD